MRVSWVMTHYPERAYRWRTDLMRWLGLGGTAVTPRRPSGDANRQASRVLLDRIGDFLLDHGLAVTPENLCAAHSAFAGTNPGLERRIQRRLAGGASITQAWLDLATATGAPGSDESVEQLADSLEQGIEKFARTAHAARSTSAEYSDALSTHMGQLAEAQDAGELVARLSGYARTMLERSRKAEEQLRQSESEADVLRRKLDCARRDAEIDYLTGLPNRRAFEKALVQHYREARAQIEPLSVAFCDIDNFKTINDRHGHEAGDRIIRAIAEMLSELADDACVVARHGGEEFAALFRGANPELACAKLDQVRQNLDRRRMVNQRTDEPYGAVTFSAGVADAFSFADCGAALAAADEALYRAKESGRNRIAIAGSA